VTGATTPATDPPLLKAGAGWHNPGHTLPPCFCTNPSLAPAAAAVEPHSELPWAWHRSPVVQRKAGFTLTFVSAEPVRSGNMAMEAQEHAAGGRNSPSSLCLCRETTKPRP